MPDYGRQDTLKTQTWYQDRARANTAQCPECHAPEGKTCTRKHPRTGERIELENFPAHPSRIKLADGGAE